MDANTDEYSVGDGVRVMTMHRAKGLEYRTVAVVGAGSKELPPWGVRQLNGEERDAALARERSLLYVSGCGCQSSGSRRRAGGSQTEMMDHLGFDSGDPAGHGSGNSRNGESRKTVATANGPIEIDVPRDRNGSFEPVIAGETCASYRHYRRYDLVVVFPWDDDAGYRGACA
jgi:hypothetical protein